MPVYVVTGKLGAGKTLASVSRIRDYLKDGRKVATNLELNLNHLCGNYAKTPVVYRVPDRPDISDLDGIGLGYDGDFVGEEKNGGLFLDECGTWFNSRDWNDKGRKELINWIIHARKKRWNVYFIIQDLEVMDKQARLMFAEHVVYCRRSDRFNIPGFSGLWKLFTDKPLPFPKVHVGFVRYGDKESSALVERWVYRGKDLYKAYDTAQVFTDSDNGLFQYIPPFLTHGRYTNRMEDFKNAVKSYEVSGFHFFCVGAFMTALILNVMITKLPGEPKKGLLGCNQAYKDLYGDCDASPVLSTDLELVEKIRSLSGGEVAADTGFLPVSEETEQQNHDKDGLYIVGSVRRSDGFDYLFIKDGQPYYPQEAGYSVRWIAPCKASLSINGSDITVTCTPFKIPSQGIPEPAISA